MRIPGQLDFGLQSLGRPDKGAMRAKTSAEQGADLAWGKALATAGQEFAQVAEATGLADANQTRSERVALDKKTTAELDAWLTNNRAFDTNAKPLPNRETGATMPTVPAAVLEAADRLGLSGNVPVYEIAVEASRLQFENSRAESVKAMGEKDRAQESITKYNQQMDTSWAISARSAVTTQSIQRIEHLKAGADLLYNEHLNNLDEASMLTTAVEAEQSGAWTPEYAGAKIAAIGTTVDTVAATRMYSDATTQGELDAADDFVDQSRIDPANRMTMFKTSRQTAEYMHTKEMRKQPVNYAKAQALLIEGGLTKGMVADMARSQEISGAHANTLRNALDTPAPLTSYPGVVDQFAGEIALIRFSDPAGTPDSVRARAEALRKDFQMAFTGTGKDGEVVKRSITGEDFAQLMQDLDTEVNTALGAGGRVDSIAMQQIKQVTGYTDFIAEQLGGRHPQARAASDFQRALIDYKDANPTGDAMEFVARNQHLYIADKYEQDYADTLSAQLPRYAAEIQRIVTEKGNIVNIDPDKVHLQGVSALLARARADAINGDIQWSDFERLRRGMEYKYEDVDQGASRND